MSEKNRVKPLKKIPNYMKSATARKAKGRASSAHPDYFVPAPDATYWIAFLPAHKNHPKDEDGNPTPFITVEKYFKYKTADGDIRNWPIADPELIKQGKDPLYKRSARMMNSEDEETSKQGYYLGSQTRVLMNVLVLAMTEKGSDVVKKGKDLGSLGSGPKILEIGANTWAKQIEPQMKEVDPDEDGVLYYDLFGQDCSVVPKMELCKSKTGTAAYNVEWSFKRTSKSYEISDKLRKMVHDLTAHPTTQPHTAKELSSFFAMAATGEADAAADEDEVDFSDSEDFDAADAEDEEVAEDPDDEEEEEEEVPKKKKAKKGKKVKAEKKAKKAKPDKKKKKAKKVEEEEDDDLFDDDDEEEDVDDLDDLEDDEDDDDDLAEFDDDEDDD